MSWTEWDGMLRVCFNRRNKTMRSSWLGTKEVLNMVERNYRVWCSMNDVALEEGTVDEDDDEEMEVDDDNAGAGAGDEEEWGGMDVDGGDEDKAQKDSSDLPSFFEELKQASSEMPKTKSKRKKTKVALLVREKIRKVLEDDTGLADQRSGKCTENDFLRLLHAFNSEGLHFS